MCTSYSCLHTVRMNRGALALTENPEPMPVYAAGEQQDGIDHEAVAQEIDTQAVERAAAQEATIASIGEISRSLLRESLERGEFSVDDQVIIEQKLRSLQQERMTEIQGDTSAKAGNLGDGVQGLSDGKSVWLNPNGGITRAVHKHERQHVKDGIVGDIDAPLAAQTGIGAIDEKLKGIGTRRDILEERAMDAQDGQQLSELYIRTHWAKVKVLERRGQNTGVDMESANADLIKSTDAGDFQENLVRMAAAEIAQENPEELSDVLDEAAESGADEAMIDIISQVRADFKNGPQAKAQQAKERSRVLAA